MAIWEEVGWRGHFLSIDNNHLCSQSVNSLWKLGRNSQDWSKHLELARSNWTSLLLWETLHWMGWVGGDRMMHTISNRVKQGKEHQRNLSWMRDSIILGRGVSFGTVLREGLCREIIFKLRSRLNERMCEHEGKEKCVESWGAWGYIRPEVETFLEYLRSKKGAEVCLFSMKFCQYKRLCWVK